MAVFAWKYLLVMFILKIVDTEDSRHNEFPHEMKCMDAACKGIISQAWTKDTFETDERHMLSFKKSELVEVQGKPTDPNNRLWLCKIFHSGERGFISEDVLKEILVFEHVPPEVVLRDDAYHEIKQTTSESTLEGTGDQVQENPGNQEIPEVVVIPLDQADANPAGDAGEERKDDVHLPDNEGHKPSAQTFEDSLKQVEPNPGFEEEPQQTDPTPAASGKDEKIVGEGVINMVPSPGTVNNGVEHGDTKSVSESPGTVHQSVSTQQAHDDGIGVRDENDGVRLNAEAENKEVVSESGGKSGVCVGEVSTESGDGIVPDQGGEGGQKLVEEFHPAKEAEMNGKEELKERTVEEDNFMVAGDSSTREEAAGEKSVENEVHALSRKDEGVQISESKIEEEALPKSEIKHLEVNNAQKASNDVNENILTEDSKLHVNAGKENTILVSGSKIEGETLPKPETEQLVVNSQEKVSNDMSVGTLREENKLYVNAGQDNRIPGSETIIGEETLRKSETEQLKVNNLEETSNDMKVDPITEEKKLDVNASQDDTIPGSQPEIGEEALHKSETEHLEVNHPGKASNDINVDTVKEENKLDVNAGQDNTIPGSQSEIGEEALPKSETEHLEVNYPEKASNDINVDPVKEEKKADVNAGQDGTLPVSESVIGEEAFSKSETEQLEFNNPGKASNDIKVDSITEEKKLDVNAGEDNTIPGSQPEIGEEALPKSETEHLEVNHPGKASNDINVDTIKEENKLDVKAGQDNIIPGSQSEIGEEALPKTQAEHTEVYDPEKASEDMNKVDVDLNKDNIMLPSESKIGEESFHKPETEQLKVHSPEKIHDDMQVDVTEEGPQIDVDLTKDNSVPASESKMGEEALPKEEAEHLVVGRSEKVGDDVLVDAFKVDNNLDASISKGSIIPGSDSKTGPESLMTPEAEHVVVETKERIRYENKGDIVNADHIKDVSNAREKVLNVPSVAEGVPFQEHDISGPQAIAVENQKSDNIVMLESEVDGSKSNDNMQMSEKMLNTKYEKEILEKEPNVGEEKAISGLDQSKQELNFNAEGGGISESSNVENNELSDSHKKQDGTIDLNSVENSESDDPLEMKQPTEPEREGETVSEIIASVESGKIEGTNADEKKPKIDQRNVPETLVVAENSIVQSEEFGNLEESLGEGESSIVNFAERTDGTGGISGDSEKINVKDEIGKVEKREDERDGILQDEKVTDAENSKPIENVNEINVDVKRETTGDKVKVKGVGNVDEVVDDLMGKTYGKVEPIIGENQEDVEKVGEKKNSKVETDADTTDDRAAEDIGEEVEKPSVEIGEKTVEDEAKISDPAEKDESKMEGENNQQSPSAEIDPDKINSQEEIGREEEVKSSTEEEKQPEEGQDSSQDNLAEETSVSQKEGDGKISPEENVPSVAENLTPTDQLDVQESENLKDFLDQLAAINEEYDSGIEEDLDEEEAASDEKKEEIDVDSEEVIGDGQDSSTVPDKAFTDKFQNLNPDEIQPTPQYEVIDGTTIYFDDDDSDFTFDQGNVNVPGDQLQPSPSVSSNQGASATPPLPVDALRKDEKETEEDEDTFLSNTDDLALANIKFAQWLTVPGSIDILFDELAAGDEAKRQNQALIRQEFNIMMNDPEWKRQIMKKMWHHFGEDDSVKDMFGSYDGDDEMGTDVEEEPPLEEDPYDPSNVLRKETSEGTDVPDETVVIVDPYNFNSLGGEDANKEEEEEATDYDQEKKMEDEWLQEDLEKTEDTTQTPQLQTDYPPSPPADYPNLPEGFPSYTEAPETEESSARNFSVFMDEMAEMVHTNMDALYHVLSDAVVPLVAMLPDEMKEVIKQPTFFGIAWTTLVWFQIGITSSLFLLFCGCACCARRNKVHQRELMMEIKMITEQKAKALDALKTTTKHFSDQNTEYFNYQQLTKNVEKEKEELKTMYEELKEEKKKQDDKYADLENMNIQLQEELDSFKEKVEHHGNANDKAKNQIQKMQKKINELETKLKSHRDDALSQRQDIESLNKENKDLSQVKAQLTSDVKEHAAKLAALTGNVAELETENKTLKETVSDKDNEIEVLKDCLVQLKGLEDYGEGTEVDNEARIQQLLDVNRANAKITLLEDERKAMEEKIGEESRKIHNLEDDNRTLRKEVEALQQECKKAKEDHEEARTKLDVLTEYFKGKEVEMQRKLGKEEALKFHSQKELDSLGEKTAAAEAEISNYKQQIQDLKDEIEKSERSFRQQIAAHEKKAHESWMLSRTAERKLKETNKEVASLRQRLTELQGRKTTDASPLIKPSPERMGSPSNASESSMLRRDQPSRNSILEDAPSPPMIGGQRQSPSEKERPPSRPVRVSRSGRPPSFHEDFFPPEDMMPPPDAMPFRGPPGGFHPGMDPYGPPPPIDGYMPPEMDFDGPPGPPPPDMGYGPPGPYDFGPRGPPPPSMGGDPRFPPPFMGPHPDDFPPDGPYGAMDPGMGPPPPFRGPPPDWNDRVPHPSMGGPPPPGGDPRTSRPVSRGGPVPSHIPPDQAPRSSTPVESGEPQNQGMQNQIRRTSYVQP